MSPTRSEMTIGLTMIVKNEALTLPRLAASLVDQIDHWTIVDTGSTDDTVKVARELFGDLPGEVIEDEWRGYGPSRNVALVAARPHSDWVLTLDADETLHGLIDREVPAEFDSVQAKNHFGQLRFWIPRLLRADLDIEWRGRAHEYLTRSNGLLNSYRTSSFYVEHHADGGNRDTKFNRELGLLLADHRDNPEDPRTIFYLARTYEDGGELARAATWYRKRIDLHGWEEEAWYATWRLGVCLLASGRADEGCGVLWRAWGSRPWRAEPLWTLAEHYRMTNQWVPCFEVCELARQHCGLDSDPPGNGFGGDRLFVHADVYEWRIDYEQSLSAYYVDDKDLARTLIQRLSARTDLPSEITENMEGNRKFYE
jgi:tetratricopeptide (TPR) repeat protein